MGLKDLEGFLNDDKKDEGQEVNWENHKREWLKVVVDFYNDVTSWLQPLVGANFSFNFETIVLQEENIGPYETKKMYIYAKGHKVVIEPKGTLIIGAKGRIDMIGPYGNVRFIYVDKRLNRPNITVRIHTDVEKAMLEQKQVNKEETSKEYG